MALRLLQLHARQQRALESQRRRLAERTARLAARMLGSAEPGSGAWPAPQPVYAAITRSMSSRAEQMLREDMEHLLASGNLHTSNVRDARSAIALIIRESL